MICCLAAFESATTKDLLPLTTFIAPEVVLCIVTNHKTTLKIH